MFHKFTENDSSNIAYVVYRVEHIKTRSWVLCLCGRVCRADSVSLLFTPDMTTKMNLLVNFLILCSRSMSTSTISPASPVSR